MSEAVRLDGRAVTLLLLPRADAMPEILHWGARLPDGLDLTGLDALCARTTPPNALDGARPQATLFPTIGDGGFLSPALQAHRGGSDWTTEFRVTAPRRGGGAVTVEAADETARLRLALHLTLPPDGDVLTMRASLTNDGAAPLDVIHLAAGTFPGPARATGLLTFDGYWGHEFTERRVPFPGGGFAVENRRGRTSHDRFPALFAGTPLFTEDAGEVWATPLGWSGNHAARAQRLGDGRALVALGELLHPGEAVLAPGERLDTPTAFATHAPDGLAGVSRRFHQHVRRHVLRWPGGATRPRPVTLNTWGGTYFARDPARLAAQATAAARLGVERFVLDDGWMRGRDSDRAGLGDWTADPSKYPHGPAPLAGHVRAQGMEFGLWVEPEMVNAQVLGVYALIDALRAAHPAVEIESCASGGGRPDLGILARTHRVWTSDCTDALERQRIQRGASLLLTPELLGAHVSASPNHRTGRRHAPGVRAAAALFGHMGVELDPLALAPDEAEELAAWAALHIGAPAPARPRSRRALRSHGASPSASARSMHARPPRCSGMGWSLGIALPPLSPETALVLHARRLPS